MGIYGHPSAKKLSDLNHEFNSWKQAYRDGMSQNGYHDKRKFVVNFDAFPEDIKAVGDAVRAYKETKRIAPRYEVINGVTFYYENMVMSEKLISELEKFSRVCEDDVYSICEDDGRLVIY